MQMHQVVQPPQLLCELPYAVVAIANILGIAGIPLSKPESKTISRARLAYDLPIDQQPRTRVTRQRADDRSERLDDKRGAHDYEEIALRLVLFEKMEEAMRQGFAKKDNIRLDQATAVIASSNSPILPSEE